MRQQGRAGRWMRRGARRETLRRAAARRGATRRSAVAGVLAAIIAAACGACAGSRDGGEAEDRSGRGGAAGAEVRERPVPVYTPVEEMRIDGYAHELVPISSRVGGVAVARDGTLAVMQRQAQRIRFFDASGDSIGSVGRRGAGPGEFASLSRMGWLGDTLWVHDHDLNRITLISPDRATVRTLPPLRSLRLTPDSGGIAGPLESSLFFVMGLYGDGTLLAGVFGGRDWAEAGYESAPLVRATVDGEIEDEVVRLDANEGLIEGVVRSPSGGNARWWMTAPFYPRPLDDVAPDGGRIAELATSLAGPEAGTFRLTVVDADGDTAVTRAYPFLGEPIPEHVADSAIEAGLEWEWLRTSTAKRAFESGARRLIPDAYPPVDALVVANDHRVWLGMHATDEGKPWRVIDTDGEPIGTVVLPPNATVAAAWGWTVWTIELDAYDVPSIVRYRLEETKG